MKKEIIFEISKNTQPSDIISKLDYSEYEKDITLTYTCGDFLKGELFTIINAYIKLLDVENTPYTFKLSDDNCYSINYIARINFFKNINYDFKESLNRHDTSKTLLEITEFNSKNMFEIATKVAYILKNNFDIEENILNCINYCLGEVIANVEMHANSKTNSLIYVQSFKNKFIKIFIIDNGDGFYKSFNENEEYSKLSENDLLILSVNEGFKSSKGKGRGYGLFHTKEFVKATKGVLSINTYGKILISNVDRTEVRDCPIWKGSIITLKINLDNKIDFSKVFTYNGNYYEPSEFEEHIEYYNENGISELW